MGPVAWRPRGRELQSPASIELGCGGQAPPEARHLSAEEFTCLRARTRRIAKITMPSPTFG